MSKRFHGSVQVDNELNLPSKTADRALITDGSKNVTQSAVTSTELGYLSGTTSSVQTQLNSKASQTDLDNHINDASDAHDASAISNVPAGNLAATDVQAALNELQSDIDTRALDSAVIKKDGSVAFTANQSMGGFKLTGLATPTSGSDAATKNYVDNAIEGAKPKQAVRVATTVAGTLATSFENGDTIDGVVLATGDRILIKDQAAPADNGIYTVNASGAPTRATDFDSLSPVDEINKAYVAVQEGTSNAGKIFIQYGTVATLGVDPINFTFYNSVSSLVGGNGITVSGSNISVDHDGEGLQFVSTQLALELDGSTLSKSASGLKLSDTVVTPGSYGSASETVTIVVDQQGRLTSSSEQSISITASQVSDFAEVAQDSIGTILVDSASIDFTYNDGTPSITAAVLPAGVDHDQLLNFVANEHVDHSSVQIATASGSSGLAGGGDITATRNLSVDINGTTAETSADNADKVLIYDNSATALKSMTRANFLSGVAVGVVGDIPQTSFSLANNQSSAADVTGLAFANVSVRSFECQLSVSIDATADLFTIFKLYGIQKGASWDLSYESTGDDSQIAFSITNAGQVQYTSANLAGFVAGTMKFRATVLSV